MANGHLTLNVSRPELLIGAWGCSSAAVPHLSKWHYHHLVVQAQTRRCPWLLSSSPLAPCIWSVSTFFWLSVQNISRIPPFLPPPWSSCVYRAIVPRSCPFMTLRSLQTHGSKCDIFLLFKPKALTSTFTGLSPWLVLCFYFFSPCSLLLTTVHLLCCSNFPSMCSSQGLWREVRYPHPFQ